MVHVFEFVFLKNGLDVYMFVSLIADQQTLIHNLLSLQMCCHGFMKYCRFYKTFIFSVFFSSSVSTDICVIVRADGKMEPRLRIL